MLSQSYIVLLVLHVCVHITNVSKMTLTPENISELFTLFTLFSIFLTCAMDHHFGKRCFRLSVQYDVLSFCRLCMVSIDDSFM